MGFFSTLWSLFSIVLVVFWPIMILVAYSKFPVPVRLVLQSVFIIPIALVNFISCTVAGLFIKYSTFTLITEEFRIYLLCKITDMCWQYILFMIEFWPNMKIVVSDEGVDADIFHLNAIIVCNHNASPFDCSVIFLFQSLCKATTVRITLASFSDYLGRLQQSFSFMKQAMALVPGLGWVGSLNNSKTLSRSWDKDKVKIANLCKKFDHNSDYRLVTPWMWMFYPEGTRMTEKKLLAAQDFARKRGYPVLKHILQPRVKGFSYLTHHLHDVVGCIIDTSAVYFPGPPQPSDYFMRSRMCQYVHLHVKVHRQDTIPRAESDQDLGDIDQWLRDRWTEKDDLIGKMKENKIPYKILEREPWRALKSYAGWTVLTIWLLFDVVWGFGFLFGILALVTALTPVGIVCMENSQILDITPSDMRR